MSSPDDRRPLDAQAIGLMTLLCLIWSLQQIALKTIAPAVSPLLMIGLRSGIAVALVALLMIGRHERLSFSRWRPGLVVAALFALEFVLVAESLRFTHAGHVVVFLYTAPVFAALGLHARLPAERLNRLQWLGIGIAFAGIVLSFLGHGDAGSRGIDARDVLIGDALALAAGIAWGATTVAIRVSALSSAPTTETLLYQLVGAFVVLVPAAFLLGQARFEPSLAVWAHLAFQSLVVAFGSLLLWFWMLRRYLASRLGVFSFATPVFGVILGAWLLDEPIEVSFVLGGSLVIVGILLVSGHAWLGGVLRHAGARRVRATPPSDCRRH